MLRFSAILLSQCGCSMSPAVIKINTMCKATAQDCTRQLAEQATVKGEINTSVQAMNAQTAVQHQNDPDSVTRKATGVADDCSRIMFASYK